MQKVFDSNKIDLNTENSLPYPLKEFLNKGIVIIDDCFYFKDFATSYSEDLFDKTGNECFNNKFYIDDYVNVANKIETLRVGIRFVECLAHKLEFYNLPFCIILSYHDNSVDVRFHKIRKDDMPYLDENINNYTEECILVVLVNYG